MLEVGRVDSAIDYATRAQDAVEALPDAPARQRAEVAVLLGRALWASGAESVARRRFSHALALLVDVDDAAADRVRALLGAPTGTRLPELLMRGSDHPQSKLDQ
jgi:hypothetical protein